MIPILLGLVPLLLWGLATVYLVFFILLLKLSGDHPRHPIPLLMAGIVLGLFYDALILALGAFLGDSSLLKTLSLPRYMLHGALIPLLLPLCAKALDAKKPVLRLVGIVTAVLMLLGLVAGSKMKLKAVKAAGITRFVPDLIKTPRWANRLLVVLSFAPTLVLIATGIVLWKKKNQKELTLSGLFMMVFSALGPLTGKPDVNFLFSMFGELGMTLFFWAYAKREKETE